METLCINDRFRRPDALVVPHDLIDRINSRGYLRISEIYAETNEQVPNISYEKIDLIKLLEIDLTYSYPKGVNIDKKLIEYYDEGHKRGTKQFYKEGLGFLERSSYFSLLFGKISIEEFKENYLIEIINSLEPLEEANELKELLEGYGYDCNIIGDKHFIYLKKKLSKKKGSYIKTGTFYPCMTSDLIRFIDMFLYEFNQHKAILNCQWEPYLNESLDISCKKKEHIGIRFNELKHNSLCEDRDYMIKLYRKYVRYSKYKGIVLDEIKKMFSISGVAVHINESIKNYSINYTNFSFCPDSTKYNKFLKLYKSKESGNLIIRSKNPGFNYDDKCLVNFKNLIYCLKIKIGDNYGVIVRFKRPIEECFDDVRLFYDINPNPIVQKIQITDNNELQFPIGRGRNCRKIATCSIKVHRLDENYYLIKNFEKIEIK